MNIKICQIFFTFLLGPIFYFSNPLDGYTLFTPNPPNGSLAASTYLINNNSEIINQWLHPSKPASMAYLMKDSTLIYPCLINNPQMNLAGAGGRIIKYNWEGTILWDYVWSSHDFLQHHDIEPLPNGNILLLSNERKSYQDAIEKGRLNIEGEIWPDMIVEIEPQGLNGGRIVWEWHFWDHLVQDVDSTKSNYGIIAENPGKLNINIGSVRGFDPGGNYSGDWMHANSIHYNQKYDQIIISCRNTNEFYIIDHSTSTFEASGSTGGNSGKGGDFLYRWGNPQNYDRGDSTDMVTIAQHSVNWVDEGFPGENNIIIYNNNYMPSNPEHINRSSILEINPPIDSNFNYIIEDEEPYGPETTEWYYDGGNEFEFLSQAQGGVFRLSNGNTLITSYGDPNIIEVDTYGNILWSLNFNNTLIHRAQKYDNDYLQSEIYGDINDDNQINIIDILILVNYILVSEDSLTNGDLNDDQFINITDILILINLIIS